MSLVDLFRNRAAGNHGNHEENTLVTATDHATPNGNQSNHGNHENITHEGLNEERAAVMEYDEGLPRKDAEQAAPAIRVYCYRMRDKPAAELTVIMPGTELSEALENMQNKYGDRLLDIYPNQYCMAGIPVNSTKH